MPLVSVVMPVRNAELYLAEAITSIQWQTIDDWELIVVDNRSTDGSVAVAQSFAAHDPRIHVLEGVRGDRASAKNVGLREARGELIALMGADDISVPERFAVQLDWMRQTGVEACGGLAARFGQQQGLLWFPESQQGIRHELVFRSALLGGTLMAEAHVLKRHPYSEQAGWKDLDHAIRLVRAHRLTNAPVVLLRHRCHALQVSQLESARFEADRVRLGSAWFHELFPSASEDDIHAVQRLIGRSAFTSLTELERAGDWLVRLADSPEPVLRNLLFERWWRACRASARLGPGAYRVFLRQAPGFRAARPAADPRLRAACALRAGPSGLTDRLLRRASLAAGKP
jgi:glycosyltransferase involved in cell wall biosynthesis